MGDGVLRSLMSSSVVLCLVLAFVVISMRSWGEYMVPPPLNAVLMAACVSLACCVVSANEFIVVRFTLSGNVGA